jgi:hypothetical protein
MGGVKAFFVMHWIACLPERVTFTRDGGGTVSDREILGRGPQVRLHYAIDAADFLPIRCNFTFAGISGGSPHGSIHFPRTDAISAAIERIAALVKCPPRCVKILADGGKPYPDAFPLVKLTVQTLTVRVVSPSVFFKLRIGTRIVCVNLVMRLATLSEARIQLACRFQLDDAAGIAFVSRSPPLAKDSNLCWLETSKKSPLECEVLYEARFSAGGPPVSWIHRSSVTVKQALDELRRRFFPVDVLRDPDSPTVPLDCSSTLSTSKGKVLQIKSQERLLFVTCDCATKKLDDCAVTLADFAASLCLANVIFLSDFSEVPMTTRCDSLSGRFFVLPADFMMQLEIGIPGGQPWRGKLSAVLRAQDLAPFLSCDCPALSVGTWSVLCGEDILPDDQFLCSVVLCESPLPGGLRIIPGDIRVSLVLSDVTFEFDLSRSLRVSSLLEVLSRRFLFRSDACTFWCGAFRLNGASVLGSILGIEGRPIVVQTKGEVKLRCSFVDAKTNGPIDPRDVPLHYTIGDALRDFDPPSPHSLHFYADRELTRLRFTGCDTKVALHTIRFDEAPVYVAIVDPSPSPAAPAPAPAQLEVNLILPPDSVVQLIPVLPSATIESIVRSSVQFLRGGTCDDGFYGAAIDDEADFLPLSSLVSTLDRETDLWIRSAEAGPNTIFLDLRRPAAAVSAPAAQPPPGIMAPAPFSEPHSPPGGDPPTRPSRPIFSQSSVSPTTLGEYIALHCPGYVAVSLHGVVLKDTIELPSDFVRDHDVQFIPRDRIHRLAVDPPLPDPELHVNGDAVVGDLRAYLESSNTANGVTLEITSGEKPVSDRERLGNFHALRIEWKTAMKPLNYAENLRRLFAAYVARFPDGTLRDARRYYNRWNYDFDAAYRALQL